MNIIVHGGADAKPDNPDTRQAVLDESAKKGVTESTPIDAVEAAINHLEDSTLFNAGKGGAVQSDGSIRTEAGLMTNEREIGAVCSLTGVQHSISVARVVMEQTPHTLVSGSSAVQLAEQFGVETNVDLWTPHAMDYWEGIELVKNENILNQLEHVRSTYDLSEFSTEQSERNFDVSDHDTVGAVANQGNQFAAATSTGGRWSALAGRIGDVPQAGGGFYCNPSGAASATGSGEDISRVTLAREAIRYLETGCKPQEAAESAISHFSQVTNGEAGIIIIDQDSEGVSFNSDSMQTSLRSNC